MLSFHCASTDGELKHIQGTKYAYLCYVFALFCVNMARADNTHPESYQIAREKEKIFEKQEVQYQNPFYKR